MWLNVGCGPLYALGKLFPSDNLSRGAGFIFFTSSINGMNFHLCYWCHEVSWIRVDTWLFSQTFFYLSQLPDSNLPASTGRDQAHAFVPTDNHQSHRNCIDSSSHQVLDFVDLQPEELNLPIDSSIQRSAGNLPLQQHTSIGAGNDASMRSRNSQEYRCRPDASPDASELLQSPCPYPLQMEMERILKEREQTTKLHENLVCPSDLCPFLVHFCVLLIYC